MVPNLSIFGFFLQNFVIRQNWGCWFHIWQYFFEVLTQNYPNKVFLVSNLDILIFSRNFVIRQIRGCWFQIWQCCFQSPVQKYPNQVFLVPNLRIFIFALNFATRQIQGCCFQIWQYFLHIPPKKYANKAFLVQNLDIFIFSWNYSDFKYDNSFFNIPVKQENWRISNMTIVISNYSPKICKLSIFLSRFKNFYFATNLAIKQIRGR